MKYGQVFLKNKAILKKIAEGLEIKDNDLVVEIGGGHGELSQFLLKAKKLFIYELDERLAAILNKRFGNLKNVEVINKNFLEANLVIFQNNYKLVGNIPYAITGKIFRKILTKENHPQLLVFTLQKEVGEKILGKDKNNFWNIWIKIWGRAKSLGIIKRKNFQPPPKVDSIIVKIDFYSQPIIPETEKFAKFLKLLFNKPNQKLKHKLANLPPELKEKRIYELNFEDFLMLFRNYKN